MDMEMKLQPELFDDHGHFKNLDFWSKELGLELAKADQFELTDDHWKIIDLVRAIYKNTNVAPPMRLLIKSIRKELGEDLASSRALYRLFPDGPVRLACKYGGLPKPKHCL